MGEKYCGNFSYHGALAIFLLFCDHQDTYSESCEMEIGVSELILAQKKETSLWDNDIHTLLDG